MHNLIHFYYQNKEKVWKVLLIIAFILGIIYYINYSIGKEGQNLANTQTTENDTSIYKNEENKTYISDQSAIHGNKVTEEEAQKVNNTISKFLQYCKNGNIQEAYNMLSTDCKESEYATIEKFQERYINLKFSSDDIFNIENWINNTYKITISGDILATGNINQEKQVEYITIVEDNGTERLNVNGYIGKKEINKQNTVNEIKVSVISKKVYMDYEEYEFEIENLSNKMIKMDTLEKAGTMYLVASNSNKYNALAHELYHDDLEVRTRGKSKFKIKYSKVYSDDANIDSLVFSNIILDYINYKKEGNTLDTERISQITIDI